MSRGRRLLLLALSLASLPLALWSVWTVARSPLPSATDSANPAQGPHPAGAPGLAAAPPPRGPGMGDESASPPATGPALVHLKGVVVDDAGSPLRDTHIWVGSMLENRKDGEGVLVDSEGRFDLAAPAGLPVVDLLAVPPGTIGCWMQVENPGRAPIRWVLQRHFHGTIRVVLEGSAVPEGASVTLLLCAPDGSKCGLKHEGKADGGASTYAFDADDDTFGVRVGDYAVHVAAPGVRGGPVPVHLGPEGGEVVVRVPLRPAPDGVVAGVVLDPNRKPMAGVWVQLLYETWEPLDPSSDGETDAEGRFRYEGLHPGRVRLLVRAAGYEGVVIVPSPDVEIVASPGAAIRGRVSKPPPADRPGLEVECVAVDPDGSGPSAGSYDHDGAFWFKVVAGTYDLFAKDGPVEGARTRVSARPGETRDDVVLAAPEPAALLRGIVLDNDGRPLYDATVDVAEDAPGGRSLDTVTTDKEGRFLVRARARVPLRVTAGLKAEAPHESRWGTVSGVLAAAQPVTLRLALVGAVAGKVLLGEARPGSEDEVVEIPWEALVNARSTVAPDGSFLLAAVRPGARRFTARVGSRVAWPPVDVQVLSGKSVEDVRIPLVEGGVIEGEVRDADGKPAQGAWIQAWRWGGPLPPWARSDEHGRFRLTGLVPDEWRVTASRMGWPRSVERTVSVSLGSVTTVLLSPDSR